MNHAEKMQGRYQKIGILVSLILLVITVSVSLSTVKVNRTEEETSLYQEVAQKAALLEKAQITDTQAGKTVLAVNRGASIVAVKLDHEKETVVYEITIETQDGKTVEVHVDAVKNVIVSNDENAKTELVSTECL